MRGKAYQLSYEGELTLIVTSNALMTPLPKTRKKKCGGASLHTISHSADAIKVSSPAPPTHRRRTSPAGRDAPFHVSRQKKLTFSQGAFFLGHFVMNTDGSITRGARGKGPSSAQRIGWGYSRAGQESAGFVKVKVMRRASSAAPPLSLASANVALFTNALVFMWVYTVQRTPLLRPLLRDLSFITSDLLDHSIAASVLKKIKGRRKGAFFIL